MMQMVTEVLVDHQQPLSPSIFVSLDPWSVAHDQRKLKRMRTRIEHPKIVQEVITITAQYIKIAIIYNCDQDEHSKLNRRL